MPAGYRFWGCCLTALADVLYPTLAPAQMPRVQQGNPALMQQQITVDRRYAPQVAPGGTVVLRGSQPLTETILPGQGYGSSAPLVRVVPPGAGG